MFHIRIYRSLLNFISSFTTLKSFINLSRLTLLPIQVVFFLADFACIFIRLIDWGGYMDSQHL